MAARRTVTTALAALAIAASVAAPGRSRDAGGGTTNVAARVVVTEQAEWARPPRQAPLPAKVRPVVKPVHVTPLRPTRPAAKPAPRPALAPLDPDPYFRTPEAAMRYLALAYNRRDNAALRHVTTAHAREHLEAMRSVATDLRLVSCERWPNGQHGCRFTHAYPKAKGRGPAELVASPAARRGWYMTALESCG